MPISSRIKRTAKSSCAASLSISRTLDFKFRAVDAEHPEKLVLDGAPCRCDDHHHRAIVPGGNKQTVAFFHRLGDGVAIVVEPPLGIPVRDFPANDPLEHSICGNRFLFIGKPDIARLYRAGVRSSGPSIAIKGFEPLNSR